MRFNLFARQEYATYVRNFIFGVEDSLVSTVGLLSGIAAAEASRSTIMMTGLVLISVEAFSMGVGSYLSEKSTADYVADKAAHWRTPIQAGLIIFISYLIAGFVPLSPYLFSNQPLAFWLSISCSLVALLGLGALSAKMLNGKMWTSSLRMFAFGGLAIMIGVAVGELVK